jgi:type IV secretion system T-DNA border endonuclease VirD2
MMKADRRTNEQAIAVAQGQEALPTFIALGAEKWQAIRKAYREAIFALNATGSNQDRELANDVHGFLEKHQHMNATPEVFAAHYAKKLGFKDGHPKKQARDLSPRDRGRSQ